MEVFHPTLNGTCSLSNVDLFTLTGYPSLA